MFIWQTEEAVMDVFILFLFYVILIRYDTVVWGFYFLELQTVSAVDKATESI